MKDKLFNIFGSFGLLVYYIIQIVVVALPFVMIDCGFFLTTVLLIINFTIPIASPIFWVWGLISALKGPQDIWATAYYIVFVIIWLPYYVSIIASLFKKR